jgi:hypothetical protein
MVAVAIFAIDILDSVEFAKIIVVIAAFISSFALFAECLSLHKSLSQHTRGASFPMGSAGFRPVGAGVGLLVFNCPDNTLRRLHPGLLSSIVILASALTLVNKNMI